MELIYKQLLVNELDSLEVNLMESISSDIKLVNVSYGKLYLNFHTSFGNGDTSIALSCCDT